MIHRDRVEGHALDFPLPPELLAKIFSQLGRSDLSTLARVSRQDRVLFQQLLFEDISLEYYQPTPSKLETPSACLLLRTILRRPELALTCEVLCLDVFDMSHSAQKPSTSLPPLLDEKDIMVARRLIELIRPHVVDSWCAALRANEISAVVALILCCVTQMKKLRLIIDTWKEYDYVSGLLTDMAYLKRECSIFDELREVTYHRRWETIGHDTFAPCSGEFWALLQSHKLQSLNISAYETWPDVQQVQARPLGTNLTSLILGKQSCVTGQTLGQILKTTPKLEILVYDLFYWHPHDLRLAYFNGDEVVEALRHVRSTLRQLHLSTRFHEYDTDVSWNSDEGDYGFRGKLGSLVDFMALETFEVPLVAILGWKPSAGVCLNDYLPPNLTHFICRNDSCQWYDWAWDYNEASWGEHIGFVLEDGEFPHQTFQQLSSLFENSKHERQLKELTLLVKDMEDPDKTERWPPWPWTPDLVAALREIAGDTKISFHKCRTETCDAPMCNRWHSYVSKLDTRWITL